VRLLLLALFVALAGACVGTTAASEPVPTSSACQPTTVPTAAPGVTTTASRATPEQAVCTLYAHLDKSDCDGILGDLTTTGAQALIDKAGGRDKLCTGFQRAAETIMKRNEFVAVGKKTDTGTAASVVLAVRDKVDGHVSTQLVPVVREGDGWKIKEVPVI